ncbi:hypothetical protein Tco_1256918 [Tanacetum coccineum]
MVNLDFCDEHNMVAFLKKPEGSEGFHQIVDFLNFTHIKYALTKNLTIYVSLIHPFWQTASASTSENGEMEIIATIDGRVKTVTEASIRRHLKLEDYDGISTLPNTEIFKQLALMGGISKGYNGVDIPLFPIMLVQGLIFQGEGSTVPVESYYTPTNAPSISKPPTSPPSMQTTHVAKEAATMPHDLPLPRVHSLRSDEGSMALHDLMVLCTILSKKVECLEFELKQTKLTYGAAYTKLIMKTQGRHEHDLELDFDFTAPEEVYTDEPDISTANVLVSIAGEEVSTVSPEVNTAAESLVQRISKVHEEANTFNAEEWDNIQAQIEAEKARLLVEMINERKRLFAQHRAKQRRNKPMTQAQQRTYMCKYIKNMGSHTLQQLKKLSFDEIKDLFETTIKRVKDFVPIESFRLVPKISNRNSKRTAKTELKHEGSKRQKTNEE